MLTESTTETAAAAASVTTNSNGSAATTVAMESPSSGDMSPTADDEGSGSRQLLAQFGRLAAAEPEALDKWLREQASADVVRRLHRVTSEVRARSPASPVDATASATVATVATATVAPRREPSVTSELFQQWLSSSTSASPRMSTRSPIIDSVLAHHRNSTLNQSSRSSVHHLSESDLFMELIRDISNELDIDVLCHKILVNVKLLTHADRGSLFLVKGGDGGSGGGGESRQRHLEAKLFDITQETVLADALARCRNEPIRIPIGCGIAGTVADTKETINIRDAYSDERFNPEIDQRTGYRTQSILSMPICNFEGDVLGVAQLVNKQEAAAFSERDAEVFGRYLTFCGIGIQNAQLFEMSVQEYRRNQILLYLARSIFEEQNNLECLVTKILFEARELLKCERCSVYLVDLDCCESSHLQKIVEKPTQMHAHPPLSRRQSHNVNVEDILAQQTLHQSQANFTMLFELATNQDIATAQRPTLDEFAASTLAQIAQHVANDGNPCNIDCLAEWLADEEHSAMRASNSGTVSGAVRSLLCMPIVNGQNKVIGAVQLINKSGADDDDGIPAAFGEQDVTILEAFAIFCGLGIHNTQMYENACKLMAKQKVALECLSYHATATNAQTQRLTQDTIRTAENYALYSFKFIDFELSDDDTCRATVRMFLQCNLVQQFHIPYDVLCRWILSIRKNYRPLKYHNWRHALNVTQTMFAMMKTGKMERFVTDLEILGLLVACLCHDLDHRGTNNAFQTKTDSPLAILYTTSTMEHHHFDQCVMILNSEGNNIFQALSPEDYRRVMKIVEAAILSTDLATYFKKRNSFVDLVENGEFDWQSEDKKELLCGMMMTACDVSAIAKPWEVQHRVAKLVADEFFDQGDMEKQQLNTQPVAMMDRERKDELPKMQVGFIDFICMPLYRMLSDTFPWIRPLYDGTMENRQHWQDLAEKVEMGLTWIDHDTIDKPVEEFAAHPEEINDIEFTVQSLNCNAHQHNQPHHPHHPHDPSTDGSITPSAASLGSQQPRRQRFSSLRKTGALTRVMRSRLSRSFYAGSCEQRQAGRSASQTRGARTMQHSPSISYAVSVAESTKSMAMAGAADQQTLGDGCNGGESSDIHIEMTEKKTATPAAGKATVIEMRSISPARKPPKIRKKRTRLCVTL